MGDVRRLAGLMVGLCWMSAAAQAQAGPADWVGIWAATPDPLSPEVWIELGLEGGRLTGELMSGDPRQSGERFEAATLSGRRLTIVIEPAWDDAAPGRLLLERAVDGETLRVVEGSTASGPIPRSTLTRRDGLWARSRMELLDMGEPGNYDAVDLRHFAALVDAVSAGLADANRPALTDGPEVECALEVVVDAFVNDLSVERARAVARALGRAAGTQTICERDLSTLTVEGLDRGPCNVARVEDPDGSTTLRARPSARSEARGAVENGATLRVLETRGRWWRVRGREEGWIWSENVRCVR